MNASFRSAEEQRRGLESAWCTQTVRPCGCTGTGPLDLREEHRAILCAICGREWKRRVSR